MAEGDAPEPTKEQLPTPEDLAKSYKIADEMERIGWKPTKPTEPAIQRFTIGGSDASKAASGTPAENNPTKPENSPQETPKPNWRAKLIQGNQGK